MGLKNKKFRNWTISYINELELNEMLHELYVKNYYIFKSSNPKPTILDVGALIGETVLYFKDQYPNARIVAFEPSPRSFKLLKMNVSQNNLKDVRIINAAVAFKAGKMNFYTSKSADSPWGRGDSLNKNKFNNPENSKIVKVSTVKLSKYITGPIDLLKLDIEGAETEVIEEIEAKLKHVKHLILEYHASVYNPENKYSTIMNILKTHKYTTKIYFSRWLIPNSIINPFIKVLNLIGLKEYWLRIYAIKPT